MITPKEARKKADELTFPYNMFFDDYITQQKKVTKLLELYKKLSDSIIDNVAFLNEDERDVIEQIKSIEEELK